MWSLSDPLALLLVPLPLLALRLLPPRQASIGALGVPAPIAARLAAPVARAAFAARARRWLPALLWLCLVLALAGPQRLSTSAALPVSGRDLVLALDLSGSMEEEDFELDGRTVTRLEAVKQVAARFVRGRGGDRVGLVIFGNQAYYATPPTFDFEAVARAIEEATIGVSGRATAISDGLGLALKRLKDSPAASRVVVLLSDGVDTSGTVDPIAAGQLAAELGVRVHTIALGPRDRSEADAPRDAVDSETLRRLAEASGGEAFRVRNTSDLVAVGEAIDAMEASRLAEPAAEVEEPYWTVPASLAFLLALALLLAEARR
ncbi:VWA domain-containing protein [Antarcticirhabdus aurantiaca]|uniref:VWA domain-containing protein n=1 Tax=Antarcticirhabdus aurantiaca TaxID=2606717 RepID=A0ACD4NJP6_9HYPH|nr:VWA domain-containing protein [Antarcticirhabdus aurantiaca]WAJ26981.1 VWA domain-containing protein [Jeongeuplla avenae]